MMKKISVAIVLSVIMLSVGLVLNFKTEECVHLHESHENCVELAQVFSDSERCPTCFTYEDEWGHCWCEYLDCPDCGNHKLCKADMICHHCGELNPIKTCKKCGESYIKCSCPEPDFGL